MSDDLIIQWDEKCVTLTINRPNKRNALSDALIEALIDAVDDAHANCAEIIVFRGNGKNFSAGFDFTGWREQSEGDLVLRFIRIETLLQKITSSPAVTIALAHGPNFGAGVDLFGACSRRFASPETTFRMPGLSFGILLGTRRFAACVGEGVAREILARTRTFNAEEALMIGFVNERVSTGDWSCVIRENLAPTPLPESALLDIALQTQRRPDTDLAQLVRSATESSLKSRIEAYLESAR